MKKLFKTFDVREGPFLDTVEVRLIVEVGGFFLSEQQFRAVCEAADAVGDRTVFYSITRGYLAGPEDMPYYTWEVPLFDYAAYYASDSEPFPRERDIGIPLDRALYSPNGHWGVLLPELFALVGGSLAFVERFKTEYPAWHEDYAAFLEARQEATRGKGIDMAWVPRLLRHVYGDEPPDLRQLPSA